MQASHQSPSSSVQAASIYERIKTKLKNGYKLIFEAQSADTEGDVERAKHLYYQGLSQITRAISMRCSDPRLQQDVKKATFVLNMAKERLRVLEEVVNEPSAPPKEEDMDLSNLLEDMDDIHSLLSGAQEAKEVISIPSGISLFDVDGAGQVTQTGKNVSAKVSHLISSKYTNPVSCLQIGEMMYPLVSKASPVLQVGEKQFMFPSLTQANKYMGVILENVDSKQVADFQKLIMSLTNLHVKSWDDVILDDSSSSVQSVEPVRPPPPTRPPALSTSESSTVAKPYLREDPPAPRTVDKVSGGIQATAEVVSMGLVWGSKVGGDLLRKGAHSLKEHIKPSTRNVEISDNTRQQIATLRDTTKNVSVLTGQAVCQLASGISALAKLVAPHVTAGVKKVVGSSDNKYVTGAKSRISEQNVKDACQVGASALAGLATLYDGLEEGAKNLGRALAEGANVTVGARYGEAAGSVAEDSIHSVVNVGLTYGQARKLGAKALVKRTAKSTASEVVRHNANGQKQ